MRLKTYQVERFQDYKLPCMYVAFPKCSFKCEKECGYGICQNSHIAKAPDIVVSVEALYNEYIKNPIPQAVVLGGLEPFDSWNDVYELISYFRTKGITDMFVIYTGYTEKELNETVILLTLKSEFKNIIVKFGRYIPNQISHYDEVLGVELASDNQYAKQIC